MDDRYLFGALPALVARLFVLALAKMSAVNVHGVSKLKRDTFFLAQTFQNIIDMPESIDAHFERVRRYYDLLALPLDALLAALASSVAERSNIFTLEEVSALVAFQSPQRTLAPATLAYLRNLFSDTYVVATGTRPAAAPADRQ